MKVLLIDPPGSVIGLNSGLAYLAGALERHGAEVLVLDFNNHRDGVEPRLREAMERGWDLAGISIKTNTVISALEIADMLKMLSKTTPLVAGGPGVSILGAEFLKENPVFDYMVSGEAERSIVRLMEAFEKDTQDFSGVPGLSYRGTEGIISNRPEVPLDLDAMAFPDYSCFDKLSFSRNSYPIVTSRGCPYGCIYCNVSIVSGKRFRARSAEDVIRELRGAKIRYGIDNFQVYDDTFTQDIRRAKEICRLMIDEDIGLSWVCQNGVRADRLDEELLSLMKEAGCRGVWFGVESLDDEVFRKVNKGEDVSDILRAITVTKQAGIPISAFFIIGLPASTYQKDMDTLRKARRLKLNLTTWSLATPYPHTELWDWAHKFGRMLRDYRDVSFFVEPKCVFETDEYPERERLAVLYKANLAFSRYECLCAEKNILVRIFKILKITMRYDPFGLPHHLLTGLFLFTRKMAGVKRG